MNIIYHVTTSHNGRRSSETTETESYQPIDTSILSLINVNIFS